MADHVSNLAKQVERKRAEIQSMESALEKERAFLMGLESALKTVSKGIPVEAGAAEKLPRKGTDIARCMDVLKMHGKPMHVDALLAALGKEVSKPTRVSLSGSLAGYARDSKWFIRGEVPNTFGLIGMSLDGQDQAAPHEQPVM